MKDLLEGFCGDSLTVLPDCPLFIGIESPVPRPWGTSAALLAGQREVEEEVEGAGQGSDATSQLQLGRLHPGVVGDPPTSHCSGTFTSNYQLKYYN